MAVPLPSFTDGVDLRYFVEPLSGPKALSSYLDRFPDALYSKSLDSRFIRFLYVLLGPTGVGWLRQDLLYARLQLEAQGIQLFDLERFYGDPFSFGRILTESFDDDTTGLLPVGVWDAIRAKDESYRTRAVLFMNAARLGGTPDGMTLAAESGIGQNAEVIENYKFLFDNHSDLPLGLTWDGSSTDLGEFIIRPRPATSLSEIQTLQFDNAQVVVGATDTYTLAFRGFSTDLSGASTSRAVQNALWAMPTIGPGNVSVSGGPAPADIVVQFTNLLSNQDVPTLQASFQPNGFTAPVTIPVSVAVDGISPSSEVVTISAADQHHMQVALDYLRPVASYPTFVNGRSHLLRQDPVSTSSSSAFTQIVRYVSGNPDITWPAPDNTHWVLPSVEVEAPQLNDTRSQHYLHFHNVSAITAYSDTALTDPNYASDISATTRYSSVHVGAFAGQTTVVPFLTRYDGDTSTVFDATKSLPEYAEFLTVTQQTSSGTAFIDNIYPADYLDLQGVPPLAYHADHFWSSTARASGAEIIEVDLGSASAINYITFEVMRKPLQVSIDYDPTDEAPARSFTPIVWLDDSGLSDGQIFYDPSEQNPWEEIRIPCSDALGDILFTRFIRLTFTRRASSTDAAFLFDADTQVQTPWTIEVRNLRIGRNISPS